MTVYVVSVVKMKSSSLLMYSFWRDVKLTKFYGKIANILFSQGHTPCLLLNSSFITYNYKRLHFQLLVRAVI